MFKKTISIVNQKGGVGKTTTSINLATSLVALKRKVLLIDLDPQGNASTGLGLNTVDDTKTVVNLFYEIPISKITRKTRIKDLNVVTANINLSSINEQTMRVLDPFSLLKKAINMVKDRYDYIIIDCPPSLGFLSINALIASDSVIIPVQCEYFSMEAVAQVLATISAIKEKYNPHLAIEGFLLTMFDSRLRLSIEVSSEIRSYFKEKTFTSYIPRNVSVSEANAKGLPLSLYKPNCIANIAYLALAREIIDHETENS